MTPSSFLYRIVEVIREVPENGISDTRRRRWGGDFQNMWTQNLKFLPTVHWSQPSCSVRHVLHVIPQITPAYLAARSENAYLFNLLNMASI